MSNDERIREEIRHRFGGDRATKCLYGWEFVKELGHGAQGTVYLIQKNDQTRAVKFQEKTTELDTFYEVAMQIHFYKLNIAPELFLFDSWSHGKNSMMVMERMDATIESYLFTKRSTKSLELLLKKVEYLIDYLCEHKIRHNDLHWGNLALLNNKVMLIDFGFASSDHQKCFKSVEWYQLARTLGSRFKKDIEKSNRLFLGPKVLKKLKEALKFEGSYVLQNTRSLNVLKKDISRKILHPKRPKTREKENINYSMIRPCSSKKKT